MTSNPNSVGAVVSWFLPAQASAASVFSQSEEGGTARSCSAGAPPSPTPACPCCRSARTTRSAAAACRRRYAATATAGALVASERRDQHSGRVCVAVEVARHQQWREVALRHGHRDVDVQKGGPRRLYDCFHGKRDALRAGRVGLRRACHREHSRFTAALCSSTSRVLRERSSSLSPAKHKQSTNRRTSVLLVRLFHRLQLRTEKPRTWFSPLHQRPSTHGSGRLRAPQRTAG